MRKIISILLSVAVLFTLYCNFTVIADEQTLTLKYDDRYVFEGYIIDSISTDTVTSYQVGYGINENSVKDTAVLTIDEKNFSRVIATAVGTATVHMTDGTSVSVTVEPAKLSIFFLIGQSNAEGTDGKYDQSIPNEDGTCYSTYGPCTAWAGQTLTGKPHTNALSVATAPSFVASSLTSNVNVSGNELSYPINGLCDSGDGKAGMDSAMAYQWYKTTGEKCWMINAAHSGTSIKQWDPSSTEENEYSQAKALFDSAKITAQKEFNAGHYTFSHMTYIWMQGESDSANNMTAKEYSDRFSAINEQLKKDMTINVAGTNKTTEFASLIAVRVGNLTPMFTYNDIQMNGQRIGHLYLANSEEFNDVYMISDAGDYWVQKESNAETGGLKAYFDKYYPDGILDYPTQNGTPNVIPTSSQSIHYGYHYSQVGYNEIGRDSMRSLCTIWNYTENTEKSEIKLLKTDGHTEFEDVYPLEVGKVITVVPVVSPIYRTSQKLKVETTGGVTATDVYTYSATSDGTIKFTLGDGTTKTLEIKKIMYGDVNDDGKINAIDTLLVKKYIVGLNPKMNVYAADVMTNGKITSVDLLNIKKYIVGFDVKFGPLV